MALCVICVMFLAQTAGGHADAVWQVPTLLRRTALFILLRFGRSAILNAVTLNMKENSKTSQLQIE